MVTIRVLSNGSHANMQIDSKWKWASANNLAVRPERCI